uniref:Uncharacterized protein n=1 Tax=Anguilla anguilla TaxID=7936 RepID=A0A0E9WM05_ANGAN
MYCMTNCVPCGMHDLCGHSCSLIISVPTHLFLCKYCKYVTVILCAH